jgi:hypothetical protein
MYCAKIFHRNGTLPLKVPQNIHEAANHKFLNFNIKNKFFKILYPSADN